LAAVLLVAEEVEPTQLLLVVDVLLDPVRQHHVVDTLKRIAGNPRVLPHQVEVLLEAALPVKFLVLVIVLKLGNLADERHAHAPGVLEVNEPATPARGRRAETVARLSHAGKPTLGDVAAIPRG